MYTPGFAVSTLRAFSCPILPPPVAGAQAGAPNSWAPGRTPANACEGVALIKYEKRRVSGTAADVCEGEFGGPSLRQLHLTKHSLPARRRAKNFNKPRY